MDYTEMLLEIWNRKGTDFRNEEKPMSVKVLLLIGLSIPKSGFYYQCVHIYTLKFIEYILSVKEENVE